MGCQVGDLNFGGIPDVFADNGGPHRGRFKQLYLSTGAPAGVPSYENRSDLIVINGGPAFKKDDVREPNRAFVFRVGGQWSVFRTLFSGNALNGQSGFHLFFGLLDATSIDRITVTWPDGTVKIVGSAQLDSRIEITY